ncbi:MAG: DUF2336 domain-containing protein [Rhizomicrobium sp.]
MHEILRRLTRDVRDGDPASRWPSAWPDDTTAPHELILLLADDRIEVARPLLLRSPLLTDEDILKLVAQAGHAHHEAVASRPHIGRSRSPRFSP